ncbi:bifunctional [glutamate--ammonia ligase]-adenylyl-L-tyrosine phosphorylase/[glutamate--ammonia-ligase] adenylyltransferase [Thiofaba sp. EF100]|uniref:bifunctional [glutamate--ammonia ligase]-adenylyl-L-tyrosine phosphorylase/[glutamate--ammonia-ligase] adenylyltransferase n=1 Tax=Thiofaba sp. EF100 TaxID=3121274 RepID=UPI003221C121
MPPLPPALREEVQRALEHLHEDDRSALEAHAQAAEALPRVLAASPFVAESLARQPGLLQDLLEQGDLFAPYADTALPERLRAGLEEVGDETDLLRVLRRFRRREMVRIAWRDLAGWAETSETLRELTWLAETCVAGALDWWDAELSRRHGTPRDAQGQAFGLVVLGMGKLGGHELNFSSDIDLIFAFEEDGETDGPKPLENSEYFTRLGQRLIRAINQLTEDGFVFRVDMRLRPWGDEGPLVMTFDQMETYYTLHGREWERYAMIKARPIAGDLAAGERLMRQLHPFVYRRYLDYGAFGQLREMKAMIEREMAKKGMVDNVKLGPGGIREVEFIGQVFQLLRGGREKPLQQRGILPILRVLGEDEILSAEEVEQLIHGYDVLRRVENRLQAARDQQTQLLPEEAHERLRLAFAMGYASWDEFIAAFNHVRAQVHRIFRRVFRVLEADQGEERNLLAEVCSGLVTGEAATAALCAEGFATADAPRVNELLHTFLSERLLRTLSDTARERLFGLLPRLLARLANEPRAVEILPRVFELLTRIGGRSVYLALLLENPPALDQLVRLTAASPWIAEQLTRHPILLDELLDARSLYAPPGPAELREELSAMLANVPEGDMERQMDELRRFKQINVLRVAAADIMDVLPVMKVSDHLTWIAEALLDEVHREAKAEFVARHGTPRCQLDGLTHTPGLAVIGYGKLGGIELGYGSDLDLVFLHDSMGEQQETDGERPLDNAQFFARLTQKMILRLTTQTPGGLLYEVDTRLRPDGAAGLLVSSLTAFEDYQREHAWTWEHQALCRARWVAGEARLKGAFEAVREAILRLPRDTEKLRREVVEMREKMRAELDQKDPAKFHLKTGPGGLTDIEFIVQYHLLAHAHAHPQIVRFSDNIRQLEDLAAAGLLTAEESTSLAEIYRRLRDRGHRLVLEGRKTLVDASEFAEERAYVREVWARRMLA